MDDMEIWPINWDEVTEDLVPLFREYKAKFGLFPHGYEEVGYAGLSKEDFVKVIHACIERNEHVPDIIDEVLGTEDYLTARSEYTLRKLRWRKRLRRAKTNR